MRHQFAAPARRPLTITIRHSAFAYPETATAAASIVLGFAPRMTKAQITPTSQMPEISLDSGIERASLDNHLHATTAVRFEGLC
jgi:hypothetical protein